MGITRAWIVAGLLYLTAGNSQAFAQTETAKRLARTNVPRGVVALLNLPDNDAQGVVDFVNSSEVILYFLTILVR